MDDQKISLPTLEAVKQQASRLRRRLGDDGLAVSHSKALEMVAHLYGYRDWNTCHAALDRQPQRRNSLRLALGDRVQGTYMSQPFTATVLAVKTVGPDHCAVELELDQAVDVVTFDSFSNFRKRVRGVIDPLGQSYAHTSDGRPHLDVRIL
jgi:hypothetical protein